MGAEDTQALPQHRLTLIGIGLFYGIGLGGMGSVGPTGWTVLAVVVFGGQAALSAWWLRCFRFGPMEWLWRRLSYGQRLPMRLPQAGAPMAG